MTDEEKRVKKAIIEWGKIKKVNNLKQEEIDILQRAIKKGNETIKTAEKEIERIENEIETRLQKYSDTGKIINSLSEDEQAIVNYRYLKEYSWVKVAQKMYISERQVFNIHKKLLEKLSILR